MRHFWGTTPARRLSGTTTPHATTPTSSVRQHTSMAGTAPVTGRYTRYWALHPLRGTAPVMDRDTRYEPLHPIRRGALPTDRVQRTQSQEQTRNPRDNRRHNSARAHPLWAAAPDQKGCTAYGSGAAHPITRTNAESARRRPTQQREDRCTRYGPRHPLRGATPVMSRCTRYEPLHPIRRGALPTDRVQRTQSQEQTRNLRDNRRHAEGR